MRDHCGDLYPSRQAMSRIMARHEPVIASPQAPGPLPPPLLLKYQQDGYLRIDELFSAVETARLDVAVAQLRTCAHELNRAEAVRSPESSAVHTIYRPQAFSEVLGDVVHDPRLVAMAKQILGSGCYIHQARLTFQGPAARDQPLFRSDFETWHVEDGLARMRTVSIVLSISDASHGPMRMIPGSHRQFVSCSKSLPEVVTPSSLVDAALVEELIRTNGVAAPELPRGSVLLVDCNLMHAPETLAESDAPRTLTVAFNSTDNLPGAPFSGLRPRPPHLAERDVVPL